MVVGGQSKSQVLDRVAEVYNWLDCQIRESGTVAGWCEMCGKCCDFDSFDHRLFVSTPELMYLSGKLGQDKTKQMANGRCPYNIRGKCTIYQDRFAGCRIFFCRGDKDFQSSLSEQAIKKLKSICTDLQIPYRYAELAAALNGF